MKGIIVALLAAGLWVGSATTSTSRGTDTIDAATFLLAFREGHADQYKGKTIGGTGLDFIGSTPRLVLTVGAAAVDGRSASIKSWDEFRAAQDARTTLTVALDAAAFQRTSWPRINQSPDEYSFSGVFNGKTMTISRAHSASTAPDAGPCPGEPANRISIGNAPRTMHCIPVLEEAVVEKR